MRRRDFITLLGAAGMWPRAARAQQAPTAVIGFLGPTSQSAWAKFILAAERPGRNRLRRRPQPQDRVPLGGEPDTRAAHKAAAVVGQELAVVNASTDQEIDAAFEGFPRQRIVGVLINPDPFLLRERDRIAALAMHHRLPTIFHVREAVVAGGLMSYGASFADAHRQAGVYVGRILNGEKPGDLPVPQASKFELVINLKTAKALGLTVPLTLQASADEVIE